MLENYISRLHIQIVRLLVGDDAVQSWRAQALAWREAGFAFATRFIWQRPLPVQIQKRPSPATSDCKKPNQLGHFPVELAQKTENDDIRANNTPHSDMSRACDWLAPPAPKPAFSRRFNQLFERRAVAEMAGFAGEDVGEGAAELGTAVTHSTPI